jgi:hypothetical protein
MIPMIPIFPIRILFHNPPNPGSGPFALNLQECRLEGEKKIVHKPGSMVRKAHVANKR